MVGVYVCVVGKGYVSGFGNVWFDGFVIFYLLIGSEVGVDEFICKGGREVVC